MTSSPTRRDDRGASLVMALGVLLALSGILAGLITFVTTSTRTAVNLKHTRNELYAADGALEIAIRTVQSDNNMVGDGTANGLVNRTCPNTMPAQPIVTNGVSIWVQCQGQTTTVLSPANELLLQRNVLFIACSELPNVNTGCPEPSAVIKAKVNFPANAAGQVTSSFVQSWSVKP